MPRASPPAQGATPALEAQGELQKPQWKVLCHQLPRKLSGGSPTRKPQAQGWGVSAGRLAPRRGLRAAPPDAAARGWARAPPRPRPRPRRAPRPAARPPARPRAGARSRLIGCAPSPDALLFPVCWENGEKKPGAEPPAAPARRPRPPPGEPSLRRAGAGSNRASARAGASL